VWIKLDDGFATHPKLLDAGIIALGIQIRAFCYASKNKTDGFLSINAVPLLLTGLENIGLLDGMSGQDANEFDWPSYMVEHRLWEETDNGYLIHDYLDWNISKKEYERLSKKLSTNGRKGAKLRWNKEKSNIAKAMAPAMADPIAPLSTSTSTSSSLNSSSLSSSPDSEFEQFWHAYPKKIGKKAAARAFHAAKDRPSLTTVLTAIEVAKYSEQWTKDNGQFIPHPATWLNQGRWADEVTATPVNGQTTKIPPFPGPDDPIGRNSWRQAYGDPAHPRGR
jgi:hypothetical protein